MAGLSQEEKAKKAEEATKRKLEENGKAEDGAAIQGTTPETDSEKEVGKTGILYICFKMIFQFIN